VAKNKENIMWDSYAEVFERDLMDYEAYMHGENGPEGSLPYDYVPTQREVNLEELENAFSALEDDDDRNSDYVMWGDME
jgi:hypothetical protein